MLTRATLNRTAGSRQKPAAGVRAWLVVSESGKAYLEEAGKQSIMKRTGLQARDLRVLDPQLSYPSRILGREMAVVINMEHIKALITAREALIPQSDDPLVASFVRDLHARVSSSYCTSQKAAAESVDKYADGAAKTVSSGEKIQTGSPLVAFEGTKVLPFEFRALEACLESVCGLLESEGLKLEREAYPALDELTSKISTLNLERVRQIKTRIVAISGRVQKVRDELEHILDNDMDMAEMYLTEKLASQRVSETSLRVDTGNDELNLGEDRDEDDNTGVGSISRSINGSKLNTEELGMLFETYFMQVDGTLNKLSTLREYVDNTEDYINMMLDEKQNELLNMGILLSTANFVLAAGLAVTGIFGINISIDLYNVQTSHQFWEVTFGTVIGSLILYILAIGWGKKTGLLR